MAFEEYWNDVYKKTNLEKPVYDDWLDKYFDLIKNTKTIILDLGCDNGNDTLYLVEKGFNVLSCDYSKQALNVVKSTINNANTKLVDISNKLPFNDNEFEVIIADLSLHYFDSKTTLKIMQEIKRVLKTGGVLLARVNSVADLNYGAGNGTKLEENYYFVNGYNKRFFTIDDVKKYFSIIGIVEAREADMIRYEKPKKLIEVLVKKV